MANVPYEEEQLTDGLLYSKYHPHIHAFTFTDMSKETVDAAYDVVVPLDKEFAEKGIHIQYLYIMDGASYTPYLLKRLKESIDVASPKLRYSTAVVADTFLTRVLQAIVVPKIIKSIMQSTEFFTTEDEAFAWLEERRNADDG